jgi:Ca2+-binding EF-hand superfamily protein
VEEQLRVEYGIQKVKDDSFDKWFKKLDKDGDGLVEMVEIALKVKYLARMELVSKTEIK